MLPHAAFVKEPQIIEHLRLIKTPLEIETLKAASRAVQAGVQAGIDAVAPGVSERDLAAAIFSAPDRGR